MQLTIIEDYTENKIESSITYKPKTFLMKTKLFLIGIASTFLAACSSGNVSGQDSLKVDSCDTQDSIITEEIAEPVSTSIYKSDDLKKFGLKGQVTKVTHQFKGEDWLAGLVDDDLVFNSEGILTSKTPDLTFKTNSDGFITKVIDTMGSSDGSTATSTYITLDENGWPTKVKSDYDGPDTEGYANFSITYPDIDENGNWTKCVFKGTRVFINIDTDDEFQDPIQITMIRKITYKQ